MARDSTHIPDAWPGLLDREQLCAYVGIGDQTLMRILPVRPVDLGIGVVRWSRVQIDHWIAGLPPRLRAGRNSTQDMTAPAAPADIQQDMADQRRREAVERVRARALEGAKRGKNSARPARQEA
jgi:predicted DNA-binding transcriptional regulator AlpA